MTKKLTLIACGILYKEINCLIRKKQLAG